MASLTNLWMGTSDRTTQNRVFEAHPKLPSELAAKIGELNPSPRYPTVLNSSLHTFHTYENSIAAPIVFRDLIITREMDRNTKKVYLRVIHNETQIEVWSLKLDKRDFVLCGNRILVFYPLLGKTVEIFDAATGRNLPTLNLPFSVSHQIFLAKDNTCFFYFWQNSVLKLAVGKNIDGKFKQTAVCGNCQYDQICESPRSFLFGNLFVQVFRDHQVVFDKLGQHSHYRFNDIKLINGKVYALVVTNESLKLEIIPTPFQFWLFKGKGSRWVTTGSNPKLQNALLRILDVNEETHECFIWSKSYQKKGATFFKLDLQRETLEPICESDQMDNTPPDFKAFANAALIAEKHKEEQIIVRLWQNNHLEELGKIPGNGVIHFGQTNIHTYNWKIISPQL